MDIPFGGRISCNRVAIFSRGCGRQGCLLAALGMPQAANPAIQILMLDVM
jgi:hypothetical protein